MLAKLARRTPTIELSSFPCDLACDRLRSESVGNNNATAEVHRRIGWRGGVANGDARTAARDAGDRGVVCGFATFTIGSFSERLGRDRLCRGPKCDDHASVGRG